MNAMENTDVYGKETDKVLDFICETRKGKYTVEPLDLTQITYTRMEIQENDTSDIYNESGEIILSGFRPDLSGWQAAKPAQPDSACRFSARNRSGTLDLRQMGSKIAHVHLIFLSVQPSNADVHLVLLLR